MYVPFFTLNCMSLIMKTSSVKDIITVFAAFCNRNYIHPACKMEELRREKRSEIFRTLYKLFSILTYYSAV